MSATIETLPSEILHLITEYIASPKNCHLSAFSRCSKTCHEAAARTLYACIRLHVSIPEPRNLIRSSQDIFSDVSLLDIEVGCWDDLLTRHNAHGRVRSLEVNEYCITEQSSNAHGRSHHFHHIDHLDSQDEFADPWRGSLRMPCCLKQANYPTYDEEEAAWSVLSAFMHQLSTLTDIYFNCSRPLPRCILEPVQRLKTRPNIHLASFWFRDFLRDSDGAMELPMLLSSQLRSIRARSCGYTSNGDVDYTHEGVLCLTNGLNSGIRDLSLLTDLEGLPQRMAGALSHRTERAPWDGFQDANTMATKQSAKLASFELGGNGPVYLELLETSFRHCDMSNLTLLKLRIPPTHKGLGWVAENVSLPSLRVLVLGVDHSRLQDFECGDHDLTSTFLDSVPPLEALRFVSDINEATFEVLLKRHGQSLRRLWFPPPQTNSKIFADSSQVDDISEYCRRLEDLALSIPRSMGDAKEVQMYRALGSLPRLQTLSLALDCEDVSLDLQAPGFGPTSILPSFDDFDQEFSETFAAQRTGYGRRPRKGHIRLAMLNAALDEDLARSIFDTISDAKPKGDRTLPFERLELAPFRGAYTEEASEAIDAVSQWWLVERDPRADHRHHIIATENRFTEDLTEEYSPPAGLDPGIESIFRKVWPKNPDKASDWTLDWTSLPLALELPSRD